ncbi:hypothetical protein FJV41_00980 [Myxococcus llanfairpwllgwyngyllgogerychwyrndrobwllllantysiliogogogochensis]|uniref:Lipoprotein LpqB beta-propeller domain-containing protein n=1 Tax=Myxococcus llanfairpwllgwyngyllgogerychwyrndrobwllllantysiliogogogochensis TaxID=2590453 RepID=A0A540X9I4_9BACT|nr:hypothetical protein [Myxococcus llanfairpwllgwyngyllgogerychwyrndrobwllllantysiliogogogochensis]TQF17951.1 hypothetical protein FJV41_00980 [Myxococcus llanfairpwllgwyngyllgogerychwyrndrobwllllantysiliogogogochensis]
MSSLPLALRPWAESLALFPEELALHLGPFVARLSAAMGAMRPRGEAEGGEPQGYDGITRRGSFDRLLVSEWLWALEAPDELVRRAAYGELSFLKPAFRQPQDARRTVVLLDAGPDQLGNPRIAHLALLIVMARRAHAAGAAFAWGVLQAPPERGTFSDVTPSVLLSWLAARDVEPPTAERLAAWHEALALGDAPAESWLVGSARLARLPGAEKLSRIEVAEVLAPGERKLMVDVRPASRAARSVVLDLPPPDDSIRLLRDPFQSRVAEPVSRSGLPNATTFNFSPDGLRVVRFHADGTASAMAIPDSSTFTVPRPRRMKPQPGQTMLAAGWRSHGGLLTLMEREDRYILHGALKRTPPPADAGGPRVQSGWWKPGYVPELPSAIPAPGRLFSWRDRHGEVVLLLTRTGGLFLVYQVAAEHRVELVALDHPVTAMAMVHDKLVYVRGGSSVSVGSQLERLRSGPLTPSHRGKPVYVMPPTEDKTLPLRTTLHVVGVDGSTSMMLESREAEAFFGYVPGVAVPRDSGLLAVRHGPAVWRLFLDGAVQEMAMPLSFKVVGVGGCHMAPGEAGLVVLGPDERALSWFGAKGLHLLARASAPVVHAEVRHNAPLLGWLTRTGEFVLMNLLDGRVVYRATEEGP